MKKNMKYKSESEAMHPCISAGSTGTRSDCCPCSYTVIVAPCAITLSSGQRRYIIRGRWGGRAPLDAFRNKKAALSILKWTPNALLKGLNYGDFHTLYIICKGNGAMQYFLIHIQKNE